MAVPRSLFGSSTRPVRRTSVRAARRARTALARVVAVLHAAVPPRARPAGHASAGQATAEYVLVLLGAASVALVLLGWLARSGRIEALLDQVFDQITAQL